MEILYDENGNMKDHKDKGILQIDYNLNLPDLIKFDKTYVPRFAGMETDYNVKSKFLYRADGVKLRKIYTYGDGKANMEASTTTDYLDGFQYEENYTGSLQGRFFNFRRRRKLRDVLFESHGAGSIFTGFFRARGSKLLIIFNSIFIKKYHFICCLLAKTN